MSLIFPLSNNPFHTRPMAISSITSPSDATRTSEYRSLSPSSISSQSDMISPPTGSAKSGSLSPPSREFSNYAVSTFPYAKSNPSTSSFYYGDDKSAVSGSISLQERRLRNKTASAKYRAKKNQQHGEMRSMIATLTKENELLMRQLDHVQLENNHLKATCDKLRGKMIAQKMLKQYLVDPRLDNQERKKKLGDN